MLSLCVDDNLDTTNSFIRLLLPTHVEMKDTGIRREKAE